MLRFHPDKCRDDKEYYEVAIAINMAFNMLSNADRLQNYRDSLAKFPNARDGLEQMTNNFETWAKTVPAKELVPALNSAEEEK